MSAIERPVVVGIGEVLWDVYAEESHFGGAPANFASHAASLGADAWMVSAVGTDVLGDRALESLRDRNVQSGAVTRDVAHPTGQVTVTLDSTAQASYEFARDVAWDHLTWSEQLVSLASSCDALCFGTLAQRSAGSRETIQRFVKTARPTALKVFDVNLRQRFYDAEVINDSLAIANAVKLNEEELPVVARLCRIQATDTREVLRQLIDRFELRLAALTCGADGALLMRGSEESRCPAPPTKVVDTVGAGDAFTATLVTDFLRGRSLAEMNEHANAVAAFVCSQRGATPALPGLLPERPGRPIAR